MAWFCLRRSERPMLGSLQALTEMAAAVLTLHGKMIAYQEKRDKRCTSTIQLSLEKLRQSFLISFTIAVQCACACMEGMRASMDLPTTEASCSSAPGTQAAGAVGPSSTIAIEHKHLLLHRGMTQLTAALAVAARPLHGFQASAAAGNLSSGVISARQAAELAGLAVPLLEAVARLTLDVTLVCQQLEHGPKNTVPVRDPELQADMADMQIMPWTILVLGSTQRLAKQLWTGLAAAQAATPAEALAGLPPGFPPPAALQRLAHSLAKHNTKTRKPLLMESVLGLAALLETARDLQPGLSQQDLLRCGWPRRGFVMCG